MHSKLYKKMTDDERLQYICNLEDVKDSLSDTRYIQVQIIELYKRLVNCDESYAHYEEQRKYAYERYHDFADKMLEKYDMIPKPTCDATLDCIEDEGALND